MKYSRYLYASFLVGSLALSGCGNSGGGNPTVKKMGVFRPAGDCKDIENYVKDYIQHAQDDEPPYYYDDAPIAMPADGSSGTSGNDGGTGGDQVDSGGASEQGSSTVTQSDIAFPDVARGLLYTFDPNNNLKAFRVEPIDQAQLLSSLPLTFHPQELVTVQANSRSYVAIFGTRYLPLDIPADAPYYGISSKSILVIVDTTDAAKPQQVVEYELNGYFLDGRALNADGKITWMSQAPVFLRELNTSEIFPQLQTSTEQGGSSHDVTSCANVLLYESEDDHDHPVYSLRYTLISSIDIKTMQMSTQALLSPAWNTLASVNSEHLYVVQRTFDSTNSELYQFSLDPLQLRASALVEGEIPNQFFIGERRDGSISIFHYVNSWNFGSSNCLELCAELSVPTGEVGLKTGTYLTNYVVQGDKLQVQGRVGPLAPQERPFSARFSDHFGYVVTYQQIDPLFVVDLSDVSQPKILDEQKIDEVSYHLEEIPSDGNTHLLLGIGGLPQTGTVVASLFEIDSAGNAQVADQLLLSDPNERSWSRVFTDYRGLGVSQDRKSFVVPVNSESQTTLAYFSVDPVQKKLVGLKKSAKPFFDYYYSRGYIFDHSLAGFSYNELELFDKSDLQQLQIWSLE